MVLNEGNTASPMGHLKIQGVGFVLSWYLEDAIGLWSVSTRDAKPPTMQEIILH